MASFDYDVEAELFAGVARPSRRQPVGYRRFASAAEALRFAIEELPPESLAGAAQRWLMTLPRLSTAGCSVERNGFPIGPLAVRVVLLGVEIVLLISSKVTPNADAFSRSMFSSICGAGDRPST